MIWKTVDKAKLFRTIDRITFRNQDIREASWFGCKNIRSCYAHVADDWARYVIVYDGYKPVCPIILGRDGVLTFFIANIDGTKALSLVRVLKRLSHWYLTNYETSMFVYTAPWYEEAQRLVQLVGFRPISFSHQRIGWVITNGKQ